MHDARRAGQAGLVLNDEPPLAGGGPEEDKAITNAGDSAAPDAARQPKEFATLAAEAALQRCTLHLLATGGFLLTRTAWGLSRRLDSLDQVRRLLRLMAGGQGGAQ